MRYSCLMAKSGSDDELPIEKHAREAAEAARKFIPKEAWEAARQLRKCVTSFARQGRVSLSSFRRQIGR